MNWLRLRADLRFKLSVYSTAFGRQKNMATVSL